MVKRGCRLGILLFFSLLIVVGIVFGEIANLPFTPSEDITITKITPTGYDGSYWGVVFLTVSEGVVELTQIDPSISSNIDYCVLSAWQRYERGYLYYPVRTLPEIDIVDHRVSKDQEINFIGRPYCKDKDEGNSLISETTGLQIEYYVNNPSDIEPSGGVDAGVGSGTTTDRAALDYTDNPLEYTGEVPVAGDVNKFYIEEKEDNTKYFSLNYNIATGTNLYFAYVEADDGSCDRDDVNNLFSNALNEDNGVGSLARFIGSGEGIINLDIPNSYNIYGKTYCAIVFSLDPLGLVEVGGCTLSGCKFSAPLSVDGIGYDHVIEYVGSVHDSITCDKNYGVGAWDPTSGRAEVGMECCGKYNSQQGYMIPKSSDEQRSKYMCLNTDLADEWSYVNGDVRFNDVYRIFNENLGLYYTVMYAETEGGAKSWYACDADNEGVVIQGSGFEVTQEKGKLLETDMSDSTSDYKTVLAKDGDNVHEYVCWQNLAYPKGDITIPVSEFAECSGGENSWNGGTHQGSSYSTGAVLGGNPDPRSLADTEEEAPSYSSLNGDFYLFNLETYSGGKLFNKFEGNIIFVDQDGNPLPEFDYLFSWEDHRIEDFSFDGIRDSYPPLMCGYSQGINEFYCFDWIEGFFVNSSDPRVDSLFRDSNGNKIAPTDYAVSFYPAKGWPQLLLLHKSGSGDSEFYLGTDQGIVGEISLATAPSGGDPVSYDLENTVLSDRILPDTQFAVVHESLESEFDQYLVDNPNLRPISSYYYSDLDTGITWHRVQPEYIQGVNVFYPPENWTFERRLGYVFINQVEGTFPVYTCGNSEENPENYLSPVDNEDFCHLHGYAFPYAGRNRYMMKQCRKDATGDHYVVASYESCPTGYTDNEWYSGMYIYRQPPVDIISFYGGDDKLYMYLFLTNIIEGSGESRDYATYTFTRDSLTEINFPQNPVFSVTLSTDTGYESPYIYDNVTKSFYVWDISNFENLDDLVVDNEASWDQVPQQVLSFPSGVTLEGGFSVLNGIFVAYDKNNEGGSELYNLGGAASYPLYCSSEGEWITDLDESLNTCYSAGDYYSKPTGSKCCGGLDDYKNPDTYNDVDWVSNLEEYTSIVGGSDPVGGCFWNRKVNNNTLLSDVNVLRDSNFNMNNVWIMEGVDEVSEGGKKFSSTDDYIFTDVSYALKPDKAYKLSADITGDVRVGIRAGLLLEDFFMDTDHRQITSLHPNYLSARGARDVLGFISPEDVSGTIELYSCKDGSDYFLSLNLNCEGASSAPVLIGYAYTRPNLNSEELKRCRKDDTSDRFVSLGSCPEGSTEDPFGRTLYIDKFREESNDIVYPYGSSDSGIITRIYEKDSEDDLEGCDNWMLNVWETQIFGSSVYFEAGYDLGHLSYFQKGTTSLDDYGINSDYAVVQVRETPGEKKAYCLLGESNSEPSKASDGNSISWEQVDIGQGQFKCENSNTISIDSYGDVVALDENSLDKACIKVSDNVKDSLYVTIYSISDQVGTVKDVELRYADDSILNFEGEFFWCGANSPSNFEDTTVPDDLFEDSRIFIPPTESQGACTVKGTHFCTQEGWVDNDDQEKIMLDDANNVLKEVMGAEERTYLGIDPRDDGKSCCPENYCWDNDKKICVQPGAEIVDTDYILTDGEDTYLCDDGEWRLTEGQRDLFGEVGFCPESMCLVSNEGRSYISGDLDDSISPVEPLDNGWPIEGSKITVTLSDKTYDLRYGVAGWRFEGGSPPKSDEDIYDPSVDLNYNSDKDEDYISLALGDLRAEVELELPGSITDSRYSDFAGRVAEVSNFDSVKKDGYPNVKLFAKSDDSSFIMQSFSYANPLTDNGMFMLYTGRRLDNVKCARDGDVFGDHVCDDGKWTTRTKELALGMLSVLPNSADEYTLYCDDWNRALPYSDQIENDLVNNYIAGVSLGGLTPRLCQDSDGNSEGYSCTNSYCVLRYKDGSNERVVVGTSLNKRIDDEEHSFIKGMFGLGKDGCGSQGSGQGFEKCGENNVYYSDKIKAVVYSNYDLGSKVTDLDNEPTGVIKGAIDSVVTLFSNIFNHGSLSFSGITDQEVEFAQKVERFDKFYVYQDTNEEKRIVAASETYGGYTDSPAVSTISVEYDGVTQDRIEDTLDALPSEDDIEYYCVDSSSGNVQDPCLDSSIYRVSAVNLDQSKLLDYWQAFTSSLRPS